jgi:hypothetical protein
MEGPAQQPHVGDPPSTRPDLNAVITRLREAHGSILAIGYPDPSDLVGRELVLIDQSLRGLLRELGECDLVAPPEVCTPSIPAIDDGGAS